MFNSLEKAISVPLNPQNPQIPNREYVSEYLGKIFTQHYSDHLNTYIFVAMFMVKHFLGSRYGCLLLDFSHLARMLI